ncbi:sensor histidine kinase [Streptomyces sp. NPDC001480]|uniref:sensor histidine kinase n=1 Tax=Streptomyces sp. NPDC001480 TaxID=3364577 RepID=UPI003681C11A
MAGAVGAGIAGIARIAGRWGTGVAMWWRSGAAMWWRSGVAERWRSGIGPSLARVPLRGPVPLLGRGPVPLLGRGPLLSPSRWTWVADGILAAVLAACTVAATQRQGYGTFPVPPDAPVPPSPPPVPGGVRGLEPTAAASPGLLVLAALTALPLMARRRYPLASFWAVTAVSFAFGRRLGGGDATVYTFLSCVVAAYSAAVYSPRRVSALAGVVAGAGLLAAFRDETFPHLTPGLLPFLALLGVGFGAGAVQAWRQRVLLLREEQRVLREEQRAATLLAVERERSRIARELHDIVTHNVSVMVIQAGAARKVMDAAPDRAREALLAVEAGGRTAMAELRHVMGLLTMADADVPPDRTPDAELAPQPGLAQLGALTARMRATGVPVELDVTGTPAPLPAGADLAAYRVVQEALTNTVKHAAGARVRVAVDHTPDAVHIEVSDTGGTPAAPAGPGGGRGLTGLRERLAVYGGTLEADERPLGGFRVRAVIPAALPAQELS